jgi:hypothetical protein
MKEHKPPDGDRHFFDDPRNVKRLTYVLYVACAVIIALDLVVHRHSSFAEGVLDQESWFGFYGVYGFVSFVALVKVAQLLRRLLMRSEDYYD